MSRLNAILSFLDHYKYLIVIVVGALLVGVVGDNSYRKRMEMEMKIDDLKAEIQKYRERNDEANKQLRDLRRNPKAIERIARERYFMKADDEDIYVLSDDATASEQKQEDETIE